MSNRGLIFACTLATAFVASNASAATRRVCFQLQLFDDQRFDCPTTGTVGGRQSCRGTPEFGSDNFSWAVGHVFELWDKDADGTDEKIGTWHTSFTGWNCVSFEWENSTVAKGEANPDVYLVIKNEVTAALKNGTRVVDAVDGAGTPYGDVSWRDGDGTDPDAFTVVDCKTGVDCDLAGGAILVPTFDTASNYGQALLAVDSAQRMLEIYHDILDSGVVKLEFPTTRANCGTACTLNRKLIAFPAGLAVDGDRVTHEMGHILQSHMFEQDSLVDDCSLNGAGWSITGTENDSCATTEGWASYVGVVSWFDPANTNVVPLYSSNNIETATLFNATCASNRGIPLQVMKAFWDLDDANNEAAAAGAGTNADVSNLTTIAIANGWDAFADGTSNHQDRESDKHGVNVRDYDFNFNVNDATLLGHNCLSSQDTN